MATLQEHALWSRLLKISNASVYSDFVKIVECNEYLVAVVLKIADTKTRKTPERYDYHGVSRGNFSSAQYTHELII